MYEALTAAVKVDAASHLDPGVDFNKALQIFSRLKVFIRNAALALVEAKDSQQVWVTTRVVHDPELGTKLSGKVALW